MSYALDFKLLYSFFNTRTQRRYRSELNRRNVLGSKGEVTEEFAELMMFMWYYNNKSVTPSFFKAVLSQYAPQFAGSQQQDSQVCVMWR